eukprot:5964521-Ditylum_brightwellii.AAC.1
MKRMVDGSHTQIDEEYGNMSTMEEKLSIYDIEDDVYDKYIGVEINLDDGMGEVRRGKVTKRAHGKDEQQKARAHCNPFLDTR